MAWFSISGVFMVKIKLVSREGKIFPGNRILIFFPENVKYQKLLCVKLPTWIAHRCFTAISHTFKAFSLVFSNFSFRYSLDLPNITGLPTSGVATGGTGGSGPPTSVQTPPEICANPLRSVLCIGGGVPCMYIVTFYCSPATKKFSDPPLFWAGYATASDFAIRT